MNNLRKKGTKYTELERKSYLREYLASTETKRQFYKRTGIAPLLIAQWLVKYNLQDKTDTLDKQKNQPETGYYHHCCFHPVGNVRGNDILRPASLLLSHHAHCGQPDAVVIVLFSVAAYIRKLPIVLTILGMGTYSICILITKNESLINFFIIYTLVFATFCILGERLIHTVKILELENKNLKQDEEELLRFLRMNKQQVRTYIEFSKKKNPDEKEMKHLLELLDESSQRNIINSVSHFLIEKQTTIDQISQAFPELTPSEHEICRLILQGKKLSDNCEILNKTENNVTAHRGHIRKKLNFKSEDNLKKIT